MTVEQGIRSEGPQNPGRREVFNRFRSLIPSFSPVEPSEGSDSSSTIRRRSLLRVGAAALVGIAVNRIANTFGIAEATPVSRAVLPTVGKNVKDRLRNQESQALLPVMSELVTPPNEAREYAVFSTFLEQRADGNVDKMYLLGRPEYPDNVADRGRERGVYVSRYDAGTNKFSRWERIIDELPIAAVSMVFSGDKALFGGEQPIRSEKPSLLHWDGRNLSSIQLPFELGVVNTITMLPSLDPNVPSKKAVVSVNGIEMRGNVCIVDLDTKEVTRVTWPTGSEVAARSAVALSIMANGGVVGFAPALDDRLDYGIVEFRANQNGQGEAHLRYQEVGYVQGLALSKEPLGQEPRRLFISTSRGNFHVIDNVTKRIIPEMTLNFNNWGELKRSELPDYIPGRVMINALEVTEDSMVIAAGTYFATGRSPDVGETRTVIFSWPLGVDPSKNPEQLKVKPVINATDPLRRNTVRRQEEMKAGKFGGVRAFVLSVLGKGPMMTNVTELMDIQNGLRAA